MLYIDFEQLEIQTPTQTILKSKTSKLDIKAKIDKIKRNKSGTA